MAAEQGDFVRRVEEMVGINKVQSGTVVAGVAHGVFVENDVVAPAVHNFRWCDARVVLRVVAQAVERRGDEEEAFDFAGVRGGGEHRGIVKSPRSHNKARRRRQYR